MNEDVLIREFYNSLTDMVNKSPLSIEIKRIVLEDLAKQCELQANELISIEVNRKEITEEGELKDVIHTTGQTE